jgi:formiminoglutamase
MKNENRQLSSVAAKLVNGDNFNTMIITSSTDIGVRLNKGRDGTRLGPKALCYHFLKMNNHLTKVTGIKTVEVASQILEKESFENSQRFEAELITRNLESASTNLIHIGGGHDHVYPLLLSLQKLKDYKKILIINIDAHCDTRVDSKSHSGTPFRNFDESCEIDSTLIQVGIHKYANSELTLTPLKKIKQKVVFQGEKLKLDLQGFDSEDAIVLLSLDSDGLDSSIMRAVSAVNSQGVQFKEVTDIMEQIKTLKCKKVFGIYEYNPKFDDLSNQGAKTLSHLIYKWLE